MSNLTKAQVQAVRKQLNAVLDNAGITGFEFNLGNARFDSAEATFQLKVTKKGVQTKTQSALVMHAKMDGVDPTKVLADGERLVEYHVRKPKYPYISQKPNGRQYKMTATQAKMRFSA